MPRTGSAALLISGFLATAVCSAEETSPERHPPGQAENIRGRGMLPAEAGSAGDTKVAAPSPDATAAPRVPSEAEAPLLDVAKVLADPKIGVDSCDRYVNAYSVCIDKHAPPGARQHHRERLAEQVAAWKQTKQGAPGADVALKVGCRTARAAAKAATTRWSCRW
ncbi:MAG: hypothetical protein V3V08_08440 [Nannocystaceae bacterium]